MKDIENMRFTIHYHYENVPEWMKPIIEAIYIDYRDRAVEVANELYDGINAEWKKTGKPVSFGKYMEDINPEYEAFIKERVQPILDEKVNKGRIFRMISGKYTDLEMTIRGLRGSRVWITLKEVE